MNTSRKHLMLVNLCCMLACFSGCAASSASNDAWFGQDKALHFGYSAAIGAGSSAIAHTHQQYRASDTAAFTVGMVCTIGVGSWKEWYDWRIKGSYWSWKDFFWDILGGAVGSYLGTRVR